jgi:protein-S-isoprenylcysteine O-methyltransferase Ste14
VTGHLDRLQRLLDSPLGWLQIAGILVIGVCIIAIALSVGLDFAVYGRQARIKQRKRSVVETGTMTLFFIAFFCLVRFRVGEVVVPVVGLRVFLFLLGLAIVILGCVVNIAGRLRLGRFWANQVTIYRDHQLVTAGIYQLVRHPLYASLIWMFYGASLAYVNLAAFLANTVVFVPFMYLRARQEEALLLGEFEEYVHYRHRVGMFFPRIRISG